ncbi:unnamed protein product [Mytilus coruscus]|uniref:Tudor domain-containing protein n=1 Tax=Mytilus coruscus TaxID=42192 RepID=A0A6J8BTB9_MYTCO|nr:unnamed protein product [Mytilus coruscus]
MHEEEFGMPARWNYLESGHGKYDGPRLPRVTSCYCNKCIVDISTSTCEGYTLHRLVKDVGIGGVVETLENLEQEGETVEDRNLEEEVEMNRQETVALDKLSKDTWVAAMYERKWYIGQVVDIDENDKEVQVKFMTETGRYGESFKWPKEDDII